MLKIRGIKQMAVLAAGLGLLFAMEAGAQENLLQQATALFKPIPESPPALENNPANPAKVDLGKKLYFEPRLSASQLISCNTCHNLGLGGSDLQETSIGHGWQKGPRNSPTVLNSVFNTAQFWDGRAKDLAEQAKGPVQASVEMNNTPEQVVKVLQSIPEYREQFREAFPQEKDPVTFDNMAKAIEVYEATLLTPGAPFDKFLQGDQEALSEKEKEGLALFMSKGCAGCHQGVNMGGNGYYPFGVVEEPSKEVRPPEDLGRFKVTNTSGDRYVFKSPSLRNIDKTMPYFHSGKVWSLRDAVKIMGSSQLGTQISDDEVEKIHAFLTSLTGEQPETTYPILPDSTTETPRPSLSVSEADKSQ